jgi:hypothetical protein
MADELNGSMSVLLLRCLAIATSWHLSHLPETEFLSAFKAAQRSKQIAN